MNPADTLRPAGSPRPLPPELARLVAARHHDPFAVLGRHRDVDGRMESVRAFLPDATRVCIAEGRLEMTSIGDSGLWEWRGRAGLVPDRYRLCVRYGAETEHCFHDPYAFPPQIGDLDLHLFGEGRHWHVYRILGAHVREVDGISGVLFATWAPNAERVSLVGPFNRWDGRRHPMRARGGSGVWELFVPGLTAGELYKFELRNRDSGAVVLKVDPYGRQFELRPATAAIVTGESLYPWGDADWLAARKARDWLHAPLSVYEVHLGSWRRGPAGEFLGYRELAERLVDHVSTLGFTHVELLPVTEHPLDASWGYQTTGYFAPTSRHGSADDFRYFVDYCHRHGIGVILDWAPGHFPRDAHGLAQFDGTALYEHADPRKGEHQDWGTLIFNYGRNEVKNFLLASAVYWLEELHLDGLRVDAVASMLYLDYSRRDGEWIPNQYGGNENLEAIAFLRELNEITHGQHPGTLMLAEESTAWPQVTRPAWVGGLGFSMKWNMGWMHDTLEYFTKDPVYRHYHHDMLTFGLMYAFTENFILPLSHDEVVHGKRSLLGRMPGDPWRRLANLRLLYTYMWTYPGKKLLFMGGEFAQEAEWDHAGTLAWELLEQEPHRGVQALLRDLNRLYRHSAALHQNEFDHGGFEWIDSHDAPQSIIAYLRKGRAASGAAESPHPAGAPRQSTGDRRHPCPEPLASGEEVLAVILNFTPVPRYGYRIGLPSGGVWREVINSDSRYYGGSDVGNGAALTAEARPWMGRPCSVNIVLPPLAAVVLRPEQRETEVP